VIALSFPIPAAKLKSLRETAERPSNGVFRCCDPGKGSCTEAMGGEVVRLKSLDSRYGRMGHYHLGFNRRRTLAGGGRDLLVLSCPQDEGRASLPLPVSRLQRSAALSQAASGTWAYVPKLQGTVYFPAGDRPAATLSGSSAYSGESRSRPPAEKDAESPTFAHVVWGRGKPKFRTSEKRPPEGLVGERVAKRGAQPLLVAANFPRSVFRNRASAPFAFSSLRIAEYTAVTMLPKGC
jgi:hypothetical protein